MEMLNGRRFLITILTLWLLPVGAMAVPFLFEGTSDIPNDVRFTADLSITGDTLTLVLTNDSLNHTNGASPSAAPDDLLTSFYFDVFDGVNRPTLTYETATGDVFLTDKDLTDTDVVDKEADLRAFVAGDNTWEFKDNFSLSFGDDTLTFGVGTAGNNNLIGNNFMGNVVDGMDYGLYADDVTTSNLDNLLLTTGSITYTWSGATGYTDADISDEAVFGLGTKPDSTGFVPEPGTALLLGAGLFGLAWHGRKR
jgi:hypothetical protein